MEKGGFSSLMLLWVLGVVMVMVCVCMCVWCVCVWCVCVCVGMHTFMNVSVCVGVGEKGE